MLKNNDLIEEFKKSLSATIKSIGKKEDLEINYVKENSINIVLNQKNLFIASKKFDIPDQIIQIVNENII